MNFEIQYIDQNKESLWDLAFEIDSEVLPYAWTLEQWSEARVSPVNYQLYGVFEGSELLGMALYQISHGDFAHLLKIGVKKAMQRKGIAKDLLRSNLKTFENLNIPKVYLEVASSNERAISLYRAFGFEKIRTIPKYYSDGQNADSMQLSL